MSTEHVNLRIYGETYPLRTGEAARLEEVARYVDARMRDVAASGKVVVTSKIAVLAALHIADELFRLRDGAAPSPVSAETEHRLAELVAALDRALLPAAGERRPEQ